MSSLLNISQSPHAKAPVNISMIMGVVIIALMPAIIVQTWFFGTSFLFVLAISILASVLVEALIQKFLYKGPNTIGDLSAVLTGVLIALNVPSSLTAYPIIVGAVISIGFGKMAFGGIGRNPFNPALVGRAFLLASFPVAMTSWPKPFAHGWFGLDTVSSATPLSLLKETDPTGVLSWTQKLAGGFQPELWSYEIYALALLLGGLFLIATRVINWRIPLTYILGLVAVLLPAWMMDPTQYADPLFHLVMGGVMLGAFFMATDYSTSPMLGNAQVVYGLSAGILCGVIRLWGTYPDGVAYSILIMNAVVPLMNKYFKPRPFGRNTNYVAKI